MAPEDCLLGNVVIDDGDNEDDHDGPGETVVAGQDPGDKADDKRHEDNLDDKEVERQHFEFVGDFACPGAELLEDEPDDGEKPKKKGELVDARQEGLALDYVGDVAIANGVEGGIRNDDGAGLGGDEEDRAAVDEPAGKGGDEGGNAQLGDGVGGDEAGDDAHGEGHWKNNDKRQMPGRQGDGGDSAEEAGEKADRKVNVSYNDDEGHSESQDRDIAGLVQKVGDVPR